MFKHLLCLTATLGLLAVAPTRTLAQSVVSAPTCFGNTQQAGLGAALTTDVTGTLCVSSAQPSSAAGAAITPTASSSSLATSLIAKASPGNYYDAYCHGTVAGDCIVYNSTTVPSAGALPAANVLECAAVPANGSGGVSYGDIPRRASTGIIILFSSSLDCNTYTASSTAYIHASVQ